ncbi:MAG: protein kinase [Myxococcota bacterium]|nr:protein kinase [Myxococcota bacterium]
MQSVGPSRLRGGRFVLRREIGRGATGTVWEARDELRRATVALKRLRRVDPRGLFLLKNEFRAIAEIDHPNLIRLGELFAERDDEVFFTMDLVEGADFLTWVRRGWVRETSVEPRTRFDEGRLRDALLQLAEALAVLHAHGKVHRDVKPSNVLVTEEGRAVLLDFGMTADLSGNREREYGSIVGTPRYMAPEQVSDDAVGPAADLYAVGVMLHEALTGRAPIEGSSREMLFGKQLLTVPPLAARFPGVPEDLDALCRDLLSVRPEDRPDDTTLLRRLGASPAAVSRSLVPGADVFVGREQELEALDDAQRAATSRCVVALVSGDSGVGRSALMNEWILRARARGVTVLQGRCFERENLPFNAIDPLVDALAETLAGGRELISRRHVNRDVVALATIFPVLRRVKEIEWLVQEDRAARPGPRELRRRAFRGLDALLTTIAERTQLVLAIDDLQWADADSLALLEELTHGAAAPHLLLLGTVQSGVELGPLSSKAGRDVRRVKLAGLEAREAQRLAHLVAAELDQTLDAEAIATEARGHPLYVLELVRAEGDAARGLDALLEARARQLDPRERKILELVVLAGVPLPQRWIAHAAELALPETLEAVDVLRRERWVRTRGPSADEPVTPFHGRAGRAVVSGLDPARRRALHARLAATLTELSAEPRLASVVVRHLEGAGAHAEAGERALAAAEAASAALAFDLAAELYGVALRLARLDGASRSRVARARAEVLRDAGRGREAGEAFLLAARSAPEAERLPLELAAADQWVTSGHLHRGMTLLQSSLRRMGVRWPESSAEAVSALAVERAKLHLARRLGRAADPLDEEGRRRVRVFQALAISLGSVDPLRASVFQTRSLRRLQGSADRELVGVGLCVEALLQAFVGTATEAEIRLLVARSREAARVSGSPRARAYAELADGGTRMLFGRLASAPGPLAEAEMRFREEVRVDTAGLNIARLLAVWVAVFRGDLRHLATWVPEFERDAVRRDDRFAQVSLNLAGHVGWLAAGDVDGARARLEERPWEPPDGSYHVQHWYRLVAACELALYDDLRGDRRDLERRFRQMSRSLVFQRAQAVRVYGRWLRARFHVALAERGDRGALDAATREAEKLAREPIAFAAPYAAAIRAAVAHLRGDLEACLGELSVTEELAAEASLFGLGAMARRRIGQLADRPTERGDAERYFQAQRVRDPERLTGVYLPGFSRN